MKPRPRLLHVALALTGVLALGLALPASAQPVANRWQASLDAFAQADKQKPPPAGGVLFVGSSSIRMWTHLPQDFKYMPVVINRGFGGSSMADLHAFARELVIGYKPAQVMVYAGDNDLADGRSPEEVLESFKQFVAGVRSELPGTRISYISIKPSPLRAALLPRVRETNALIAGFVRTLPNTGYIDIFGPMMTDSGKARPELFLPDRLHLNEAGYQLWRTVIAQHLPAPDAAQPQAMQAPDALAGKR
jgi:lysophospholipase L1-like esterase